MESKNQHEDIQKEENRLEANAWANRAHEIREDGIQSYKQDDKMGDEETQGRKMLPTTTTHVDGVKGKEADNEGGEGDENERTMLGIFANGRLVPTDDSIIDGDDKEGNKNQKAQTANSSNEECSTEMAVRERKKDSPNQVLHNIVTHQLPEVYNGSNNNDENGILTFKSFQEVPLEGRRIINMDKNRIPNLRITNYDNHNYANTDNSSVINIIAAEVSPVNNNTDAGRGAFSMS
ncbi:hypothetical protein HAX54_025439 [Datura stramonium]|uniref:Uncharacterized protein n=1 Tax=Datura stramonium TaxID=4076 RepID=A0ABS8S6K9_DATST|nr:hypothetical protein [Datura stramonium]